MFEHHDPSDLGSQSLPLSGIRPLPFSPETEAQPQGDGSLVPQPQGDGSLHQERLRHLLYGSLAGIDRTIKILHVLGYANPNDWSEPMPVQPGESGVTGQPHQWMVIMTKILLIE